MKLIGIKTNLGYYITDNIDNEMYFSSSLHRFLINGEKPKSSFKRNWYVVDSKPETVQQEEPRVRYNFRYELIDKSLIGKFKEFYSEIEVDEDEDHDFNSIKGLYNRIYDEMPESIKDVPFEFTEILEVEVFNEPSKFSYKMSGQYNKDINFVTASNIKYDWLADLITPEILKHEIPCTLSQYETYGIIRAYIKENINPKVAQITSDYDFCFTVQKQIKLAKEYTYKAQINYLGSKKPKYETRLQKTNDVKIFEMCHKPYQTYTPVTPFTGKNQKDLQNNIDSYLEHLIAAINEPLEYCSCCEGTGIKTNKLNDV